MTPAPWAAAYRIARPMLSGQVEAAALAVAGYATRTERMRAPGARPSVPEGLAGFGPLPATAEATSVPFVPGTRAGFPYTGPVVTFPARPVACGSTAPPRIATVTPRPRVVRHAARRSRMSCGPAARPKPGPERAAPASAAAGGAGASAPPSSRQATAAGAAHATRAPGRASAGRRGRVSTGSPRPGTAQPRSPGPPACG